MAHTIKLVRHGESEHNTGRMNPHEVGDHAIPLSPRGREQAREVGARLGGEFLRTSLLYVSPYRRTRETLEEILTGGQVTRADLGEDVGEVRIYEDPRLREVEHGYEATEAQEELRRTHGWFYYRFRGGESPADCFDRTSNFLESMMRQAERRRADRIVIVTHGLLIRCFVMRFLHLTVEEFDRLANPCNGAVVTLAERTTLAEPLFVSGRWGVEGLSLRDD